MKYIPAISFCGQMLSILPHGWNLIDHHCKLQSELIGTIENSQKSMLILQGVCVRLTKLREQRQRCSIYLKPSVEVELNHLKLLWNLLFSQVIHY